MTELEYKEIGLILIKKYFKEELFIDITNEEIEEKYGIALKLFVKDYSKLDSVAMSGVSSVSQNGTSISFSTNSSNNKNIFELSDKIKDLLPSPIDFYSW